MQEPSLLSYSSSPSPPPLSPPHSPWTPLMDLNSIHDDEKLFCCDQFLLHNRHNFKPRSIPVRFMFFTNNCWHDFEGKTLDSLRRAFTGGKTNLTLKIDDVTYTIDFLCMLQINHCSGNRRSIAWFDEKGKHFFPKRCTDCDLLPNPLKDNVANKKGKRKIDLEEISANDCGGTKQKSVALTSKFPNATPLRKNHKTYMHIINLFLSNIAKFDHHPIVTDIHEFQISGFWGRARRGAFDRQIKITKATRGNANVVYAWYAVPAKKVASIFSHGFELITNPATERPSFGAGIFLADLKSPQHSGIQHIVDEDPVKHLILCKVVLGNVEKIELELKQTSASRKEFDTGSDDPEKPTWYVVWANDMNTHILPVCVVSCITSAIERALILSMDAYEPLYSPKVMSMFKNRIPIADVPALEDLYASCKKNRMRKGMFYKLVEKLVGEEILQEIEDELRGGHRD